MTAWPADKVERIRVADLLPYARNARKHSAEQIDQLCRSITEWGWTIPVLIDEANNILAGHGRIEAAAKLGLEDVPCMRANGWSEEKKRAYIIADNKLAENASWDSKLLAVEIASLVAFDVSLIGFTPAELKGLARRAVWGTDPDVAPPLSEPTISRPGALWHLGDHRIMCGDATKAEDVERLFGGARPNLMVTDPPYGVNYDASWRRRAGIGSAGAAEGVVNNDDRADWFEAWRLFPGKVAYVWHGGLHTSVVSASLEEAKFKIRAQVVWVKQRPAISRGNYHWQHEPCYYAVHSDGDDGWRFAHEHEDLAYAVKDGSKASWQGSRKQSTVWFIEHIKSETGHSTQKPVECMRRPMLNNSQPGDAVYDPFLGSGTTLIAATMEARICFGMELDPRYVDVAVKRWEQFTGEKAYGHSRAQAETDQTQAGVEQPGVQKVERKRGNAGNRNPRRAAAPKR